ncbi:MAG: LamG-like jellyroll fold domain-containing protein, partial [Limisphaerales bacterium]
VDIYLDGVLYTNVGGGYNTPVSLTRFILGAADTTPDNGFSGSLDEFAVYDLSVMSADQIGAKAQYMATNHYAVAHATSGPSYTDTVLADNPLIYYDFNEAGGNAAQLAPVSLPPINPMSNDLLPFLGAGRVEHSVLSDGLYLGNAADFNGSSYYEASQLNPGGSVLQPPWAVSFWMQSLGTNQDSFLANFSDFPPGLLAPASPGFVFNSSASGTADELDLFDGANYTASGATVTDNKWHYVLWVDYGNGTVGAADRVDLYLDGTNYPYVQNLFNSPLDVTGGLVLGARQPGYNYFQGRLDEFAVYDLSSLTNEDDVTAVAQQMVTDQLAAAVVPPPQHPTLNFSAAGGQLTLSWQGTGVVLQENTNLDDPTGWSDVGNSNSPVVITPASTGNMFYRLKSQ